MNKQTCNCKKYNDYDGNKICISSCKICQSLINNTCNLINKGGNSYVFSFKIKENNYIFKIQDNEIFVVKYLEKFIKKNFFNQHILLNIIYCIKQQKINYFNNDILILKDIYNIINKDNNNKIIIIQKKMNTNLIDFFNKINYSEDYLLLYILDSLIQLYIFKKNGLNYSDFKIDNIMFSNYPRQMFQIIDFSLKQFTPYNNFIVNYCIFKNKLEHILPHKLKLSDHKNINNNIYYDLNCFIVSLNDIFNYNEKIFRSYTHNNLYIELYNYIKNKDINIFCNKIFKKKIKNNNIKILLQKILEIYKISNNIDKLYGKIHSLNSDNNAFFINIIDKNENIHIYDDIYILVLNFYCSISNLSNYNIKLEVINEIYKNKLNISNFNDNFIIKMYNYINNIDNNYDNIKEYIKQIYDVKKNIIKKKDIYINNKFYDDLYIKIKK